MLANGITLSFSETKGSYMLENLNTNSLMTTQPQPLLIVFCVRQQTTRKNSSSSKLTQMAPKSILKAKYPLN